MLGQITQIDYIGRQFKKEVAVSIMHLPGNERHESLGGRCFAVGFDQIEDANLNPEYYDFAWQYEVLANIIMDADLTTLAFTIEALLA
jgi:hypothetical protein